MIDKIMLKVPLLLLVALLSLTGCVVNHTSKFADHDSISRQYMGEWETEIGYAQVVRAGNTLYLSGVVSGGETMESQLTSVYRKIGDILTQYGATPDHIVKEVLYTTDINAVKQLESVRRSWYSEGLYPAATWVQIERLYMKEAMIEVDVTVALPR